MLGILTPTIVSSIKPYRNGADGSYINGDQLSFEDRQVAGKTLGSSFGDSRFCPMRTQGNELITDDMKQG